MKKKKSNRQSKKTIKEVNVILDAHGLNLDPEARKELDAIVVKYQGIMEKLYFRFTREMMTVCIRDFVKKEMVKMGVIDEIS